MAGCKLTKSLEDKACRYSVAGARALYLANYYPPTEDTTATDNVIKYTRNSDGLITNIALPADEKFYKINGSENTISFSDALLVGGNGGKYRQHTVNAVLNQYDVDVLNEGDALSLGKFIAIVVDKSGRIMVLGRVNGLTAPAGGFDYNSGAADADASGWTMIQQGLSNEIAPLVETEDVITPIHESGQVNP